MSNNFLQWNPGGLSQEDDAAYSADAMRAGGAVSGIFSKELANKLFYQVTTMVAAFGEALSNKGYHPSDADIATLITLLSNVLTKADFGSAAGTACEGNDPRLTPAASVIPPTTKMWFYQNTAPSGWVIDSTPADAVLAVRGGSTVYSANGGTQAGTWTQPSHTHTGPSHTHTGPSHTHTTGDVTLTSAQSGVGVHSHMINVHYGVQGGLRIRSTSMVESDLPHPDLPTDNSSAAQDASQAHNHGATGAGGTGATGSSGTGATGSSGTAATWRPLAQLGIICIKS